MYVFLNNAFVDAKKAQVSVYDQGLLRGDGLFETMRARAGRVHFLAEHFSRISTGAALADIEMPLSESELRATVTALLEKNALSEAKIRLLLTRGAGETMDISERPKSPTFLIMAEGIDRNPYQIDFAKGVAAITVPICIQNNLFPHSIKTTSYFHNMFAKRLAKSQGAFEAILIDQHDQVVEGSTSNLFWVREGKFYTSPLALGPLPGITRKTIAAILQKHRQVLHEEQILDADLEKQDEVFLSGSVTEIVGIHSINRKKLVENIGPKTLWIAEEFQAHLRKM